MGLIARLRLGRLTGDGWCLRQVRYGFFKALLQLVLVELESRRLFRELLLRHSFGLLSKSSLVLLDGGQGLPGFFQGLWIVFGKCSCHLLERPLGFLLLGDRGDHILLLYVPRCDLETRLYLLLLHDIRGLGELIVRLVGYRLLDKVLQA